MGNCVVESRKRHRVENGGRLENGEDGVKGRERNIISKKLHDEGKCPELIR